AGRAEGAFSSGPGRGRRPARAPRGGFPPFLIRNEVGVRSGLMGLEYCASVTVAEGRVLANPATLGSVPTNAGNQDVVGMGTVAVRQARTLLDGARRVVAIELLAGAEAADLIDPAGLAGGTRAVYGAVRALGPPLLGDRPRRADVERLAGSLARVVLAASARA